MTTAALREPPANEPEPPVQRPEVPAERLRSIIDEHGDFLWRSLRRLGVCDADLADAAQQVLLVVIRRMADIQMGKERAFLFQAALRMSANVRRSRRRRREVPDEVLLEHDDARPGPDDYAEQRRRRAQLDAILECLTLELRAVFVLSELEGISMAQIAVMLGIPAGTVASRLRRARQAFDNQVKRLHREEWGNLP
jgi:RNA polymerase sigma-70 factor (ECF subfamily)